MEKRVKKILFLFAFAFILFCVNKRVFATSISVSNTSPKVGDSVTITVTVPNVNTADVHATVGGAGTSGTINVVGANMSGDKQSFSNSITVKPISTGTISVAVTSGSTAVADGNYVNVGASTTINVSAAQTDSGNNDNSGSSDGGTSGQTDNASSTSKNRITSLGITPLEYDFSNYKVGAASGTTYSAKVPNSVTSITVYANTSGGTLTGTGAKTLREGTNRFTVSNGDYTYYINVTRESLDGEEPANNDGEEELEETEEEAGILLDSLAIEGYEFEEEFKSDVFEYVVKVKKEMTLADLEALKEKVLSTINVDGVGSTVEVEITEDGVAKLYVIISDDEKEYARYTITFEVEEEENVVAGIVADTSRDSYDAVGMFGLSEEQQAYAILGCMGVIILIAVIACFIAYFQHKRLQEYEYDEYGYEDEDNSDYGFGIGSEFNKMNNYTDEIYNQKKLEEQQKAEAEVENADEDDKETSYERKWFKSRGTRSTGGKH